MDFGKLHAELMLEFHNSREMADRSRVQSEIDRFRSRANLCFMFGGILGRALSPEEAASILRERFGATPMEIDRDHEQTLELLADGASIYCGVEKNMLQVTVTGAKL